MTELLCALSLGTGLFGMFSALLGLPTYKTAKNARRARGRQTSLMQRLQRTLLLPALKCVAPFVRLEPWKEKKIEQQFNRAGIPLTPREYYAKAVVLSVSAGMVLSGIALLGMSVMFPVAVILAVVIYIHCIGEVKDKLKEKDKKIEEELPQFIRAIVQGLRTEPDITKLFETYSAVARPGLKYDIEVLLMDLKSGSFEAAMSAFDHRVGNAYVSRLSKSLISIDKGVNQDAALQHLMSDMFTLAHETLKRELDKRPGRVRMMVIPVVVLGIATLFTVIGIHLFSSLGGLI